MQHHNNPRELFGKYPDLLLLLVEAEKVLLTQLGSAPILFADLGHKGGMTILDVSLFSGRGGIVPVLQLSVNAKPVRIVPSDDEHRQVFDKASQVFGGVEVVLDRSAFAFYDGRVSLVRKVGTAYEGESLRSFMRGDISSQALKILWRENSL